MDRANSDEYFFAAGRQHPEPPLPNDEELPPSYEEAMSSNSVPGLLWNPMEDSDNESESGNNGEANRDQGQGDGGVLEQRLAAEAPINYEPFEDLFAFLDQESDGERNEEASENRSGGGSDSYSNSSTVENYMDDSNSPLELSDISDDASEGSYDLNTGRTSRAYSRSILRSIQNSWPCYLTALPNKLKLPAGTIFWGYVTSMESPSSFTVKPMNCSGAGLADFITDATYWKFNPQYQLATPTTYVYKSPLDLTYVGCHGRKILREHLPEPQGNMVLIECMRSVLELEKNLYEFLEYRRRYRDYQRVSYEVGHELVAAKADDNQWRRAIVLTFNDLNEDAYGNLGMTTVRLIDHGDVHLLSINKVCRLPREFAQMGCFIFTCSITGVVPSDNDSTWSAEANKAFRSTVQCKRVLVSVKAEPEPEERYGSDVFERKPYLIRLSLPAAQECFQDVALDLVEGGNALPFNEYGRALYPANVDKTELTYHINYDLSARWIETCASQTFDAEGIEDGTAIASTSNN